ncbi:unnamed protein product [Musa textilis]
MPQFPPPPPPLLSWLPHRSRWRAFESRPPRARPPPRTKRRFPAGTRAGALPQRPAPTADDPRPDPAEPPPAEGVRRLAALQERVVGAGNGGLLQNASQVRRVLGHGTVLRAVPPWHAGAAVPAGDGYGERPHVGQVPAAPAWVPQRRQRDPRLPPRRFLLLQAHPVLVGHVQDFATLLVDYVPDAGEPMCLRLRVLGRIDGPGRLREREGDHHPIQRPAREAAGVGGGLHVHLRRVQLLGRGRRAGPRQQRHLLRGARHRSLQGPLLLLPRGPPQPRNASSFLTFGPNAAALPSPPPRETALVLDLEPFYTVGVDGISVDGELLAIPRIVWDVGAGGGAILDSGTSLTVLAEPAYRAVASALSRRLEGIPRVSVDPFDYCYNWTAAGGQRKLPQMVVHLAGSAALEPPAKSYVIDVAEGVKCLGIAVAPWPGVSTIGNILQQEHLWEFDLKNRRLRFRRSRCRRE